MQQQTIEMSGSFELVDVNVGEYSHPTPYLPFDLPDTPSSWQPHATGGAFNTAVMVKDVNNNFRIFAAHAIKDVDAGAPASQWVVQWYVIDPDLAGFGTAPDGWEPSIVAQGRIENEGDAYHPVIVVNRQGQAFIEYTYSDDTDPGTDTWPEVRRVRLNSTYTGIVGAEQIVRVGPDIPYVPSSTAFSYWADYADAQADPFNQCAYWSTHTLVTDDTSNPTNKRDVWLFHQPYANSTQFCLQTLSMLDLNDDGVVDALDLVALTDLYARGARRIDLNADGVTDRHDLDLYMAAYEEYTRQH